MGAPRVSAFHPRSSDRPKSFAGLHSWPAMGTAGVEASRAFPASGRGDVSRAERDFSRPPPRKLLYQPEGDSGLYPAGTAAGRLHRTRRLEPMAGGRLHRAVVELRNL